MLLGACVVRQFSAFDSVHARPATALAFTHRLLLSPAPHSLAPSSRLGHTIRMPLSSSLQQ